MSAFDPYQPPASDFDGASSSPRSDQAITDVMTSHLIQTRPWVLFLAIMGFIGSGFLVLLALVMFVTALTGASLGGEPTVLQGGVGIAIAVFYMIGAIIYLLPCYYLMRYGSAIGRFRLGQDALSFEDALVQQKNFWRTTGIITAASMVLYILFFVVVFVAMIVIGAASTT